MKKILSFLFVFFFSLFFAGAQSQHIKKYKKKPQKTQVAAKKKIIKYGTASFYAPKFHGRKTANGETHRSNEYTAACNSVPLNTWIKVTNLRNNKSVVVRVNDRLHPKNKRLVDLSRSAADKLGYVSRGLTKVKVEVLGNRKTAT